MPPPPPSHASAQKNRCGQFFSRGIVCTRERADRQEHGRDERAEERTAAGQVATQFHTPGMRRVLLKDSEGTSLVDLHIDVDVQRLESALKAQARAVLNAPGSGPCGRLVILCNTTSEHYDAIIPRSAGGVPTVVPVLTASSKVDAPHRAARAVVTNDHAAEPAITLVDDEIAPTRGCDLAASQAALLRTVLRAHLHPIDVRAEARGSNPKARREARAQYLRAAIRCLWACKLKKNLIALERCRADVPRDAKLVAFQVTQLSRLLDLEPRVRHVENLTPTPSEYADDEVYCLLTDLLGVTLVVAGIASTGSETSIDAATVSASGTPETSHLAQGILPSCFLSVTMDAKRYNDPIMEVTSTDDRAAPPVASSVESFGVLCNPILADPLRWRRSRAKRWAPNRRDVTRAFEEGAGGQEGGGWFGARLAGGQLTFSPAEWTAHGINDLRVQDVLRVRDDAFEPCEDTRGAALAPGWESYKTAHVAQDGRCFYHAVVRGLEHAPRFPIRVFEGGRRRMRGFRLTGGPPRQVSACVAPWTP